jgi:hypothetical protein
LESGYELDVGLTFIHVRQSKKSLQIFRPSGCGEHEYRRTGAAVEHPSFVIGRWPGFRKPKLTAISKHEVMTNPSGQNIPPTAGRLAVDREGRLDLVHSAFISQSVSM